jgi:catechol 2,3-dioxygenase-like lactoylglutathione lyase family enzyme
MDWTLEVVVVPVSDVDRAIAFYRDQLGLNLDHDTRVGDQRFAQLTPRGSGCSIVLSEPSPMPAGSLRGLQLVVADPTAPAPNCSSEESRSGTSM